MPPLHHNAVESSGSMLVALLLVLTALLYLCGWLRLRPASEKGIAAWRGASFLAGLILVWVATASPIAALDERLLTVHMIQHLLLMTLAPPLIWLGDPVRLMWHGFPERLGRMIAEAFRQPLALQLSRTLVRPMLCLLAASATLVGWHIPALFELGMRSGVWHAVEQSSFLVTGLLFWWPVIQPWPSAAWPDLAIILYLFFATLPCDVLSAFLVFCDRVVFPMYLSSSQPFGVSALEDQQCAGALMWTCVTVVYLVAGAIVTMRLLSPRSFRGGEWAQSK